MAETMTKKWNRAPLAPERVEEMERYLNKMSHEGWQCCEIVRDELRFVRGEQDEYTYRVQYFYESRDGEKDDYLRTLDETGAALVGEYGEVLILRKRRRTARLSCTLTWTPRSRRWKSGARITAAGCSARWCWCC